jgi:hypothetical protein
VFGLFGIRACAVPVCALHDTQHPSLGLESQHGEPYVPSVAPRWWRWHAQLLTAVALSWGPGALGPVAEGLELVKAVQ